MKAQGKKLKPKKAAPGKNGKLPAPNAKPAAKKTPPWNLRLYVAGQTPKSLAAFANLKNLCETHLSGQYLIEVIDLSKQPHLAQND